VSVFVLLMGEEAVPNDRWAVLPMSGRDDCVPAVVFVTFGSYTVRGGAHVTRWLLTVSCSQSTRTV